MYTFPLREELQWCTSKEPYTLARLGIREELLGRPLEGICRSADICRSRTFAWQCFPMECSNQLINMMISIIIEMAINQS